MEEKLSRKDLYFELWKGRDLELTNLWQRSIFLMSFLVLAFTLYFGLWILLFSNDASSRDELLLMNFGFTFITVFGLMTSILWIMMSKGSKYWYEKYEGSISRIIEDGELLSCELANSDRETEINNEGSLSGLNPIFSEYPVFYPRHGYLENIALNKDQVNNSLLSTKAGTFSVSKVNIGIGLVTGWFWFLFSVIHIVLFCLLRNNTGDMSSVTSSYISFQSFNFLETLSPTEQSAVRLLIDSLPKWAPWLGILLPGLFLMGFIVMLCCGLFSSSESKMLKRRNLKNKLKHNFPKHQRPSSNSKKGINDIDNDKRLKKEALFRTRFFFGYLATFANF